MLVDYERAFLELRAKLLGKNSWGQRDLLSLLTRIEVDCRLPESERDFNDAPRSTSAVRPLREAARHG